MDWTRGQAIGHGSSATVSLATSHLSGNIFAVKSAELSQSEFLQREQQIISSLSGPHMVSYKGCDVTMENDMLMYNLFMEYVPGGTLTDVIRKRGGRLEESVIGYYAQQIVQGLEYLHSQGLVHCDIKGRNILISEENGAKIADFGCAKWVDHKVEDRPEMPKIGGTPMFMAPEVARGEEQGFPCDIWALGCTVIEMATGGAPWPNVSDPISALFQIAYSGELPEFPSFLSEQAKDFLDKCLRRSPKERWTASQLLKHPFLMEFNSSAKIIQESNYFSTSPTTILDQGFWNSMEDSELNVGSLIEENPGADRIRWLSLLSEVPDWTWDEKWITIRGNNGEEEINMIMDVNEGEGEGEGEGDDIIMCCSGSTTASISKVMVELKSTVGSENEGFISFSDGNVNSGGFISSFECGKSSVDLSHFSFERHKEKMLLPSIPSF